MFKVISHRSKKMVIYVNKNFIAFILNLLQNLKLKELLHELHFGEFQPGVANYDLHVLYDIYFFSAHIFNCNWKNKFKEIKIYI